MKKTLYWKLLLGYLIFGILGFILVSTVTAEVELHYLEKQPPFSRLPIGMRTSCALLFNNTHFRQRFRCFLLVYTARRRAVGTKEHCFAKNGGACGRGFFAHFVFHFFLLRLVFLCTCDLESSLTANSIYGFQQISTLKA